MTTDNNPTADAVHFDLVTQSIKLATSGWVLDIHGYEGSGAGVELTDPAAGVEIFGLGLTADEARDLGEALLTVVREVTPLDLTRLASELTDAARRYADAAEILDFIADDGSDQ